MFRRLGQDFQLRKVKKILKRVNNLKGKMSSLSDQELVAKTVEFRQRLSKGESLDDLLVEAFAVVREADKRILGMFPYDVQVMGAIVMHYGNVAEDEHGGRENPNSYHAGLFERSFRRRSDGRYAK